MKNAVHMLKSVEDTICNSFIVTTEDGKIIVIDGGHKHEKEYFLQYLKELTGEEKPHVDAWFLTHPHADHISVFFSLAEDGFKAVSFDTVYFNFPSKLCFEGKDEDGADSMEYFYRVLPAFADKARILCGGDKLEVGAAKFTVLYSQDFEIKGCNNSSLVFRMDLGGKSVLFTGDSGKEASEKILRIWKDTGILNCDIVTMSHHGQDGCTKEFYEAVNPSVCLWPTPSWLWTNLDGTGTFKTLETREWINAIGVKEQHVMKDGTQVVEL